MTSRERMMSAMRKMQPDRCPVAPDISNMIPAKLTGKPFWDIYFKQDPPLWRAYIEAIKHYQIDGWFTYGELHFQYPCTVEKTMEILSQTEERLMVRNTYHTPAGELTEVVAFPIYDPPTVVEKMVKDLQADFEKYKYMFQAPIGFDATTFNEQKEEFGELGILSISVAAPGLHSLVDHFEGGLESLTYAMCDYPELFDEIIRLMHNSSIAQCKFAIEAGTDAVLTGGSGSITLSSPELWRKYSLPTIKEITQLCKAAGVISGIHSCGFEMYIVETCAQETDLDYINPLEIPHMGDSSLSKARELVGDKLCLMGNLHTVEVMLNGRPEDVRCEALKALLDAGKNGAFVLSTGDQCGRDTPEANLFALADAMKEFGTYPLDVERIENEICRIENARKLHKKKI